jgi:hypothetical protein
MRPCATSISDMDALKSPYGSLVSTITTTALPFAATASAAGWIVLVHAAARLSLVPRS